MSRKKPQPPAPVFPGPVEAVLVGLASATMMGVALAYATDVNRVFDVPKATVLKVGGSLGLLLWLGYGAFGPGFRWRSVRLFGAPVTAVVVAVGLSTVFSIDPLTSEVGVYERQFGFQGYLACGAIFFSLACGLQDRRGALLGLGLLAFVGGLLGTYAHLQGLGLDPHGFVTKANTKVFSFLGNATFAGNALALIFPVTTLLTATALGHVLSNDGSRQTSSRSAPTGGGGQQERLANVVLGAVVVLGLQVVLGRFVGGAADEQLPLETKRTLHILLSAASLVFMLYCAAAGSSGVPGWQRSTDSGRRRADQMLAGTLVACTIGIVMGLVHSRTRGAWVGSGVAVFAGLALLPYLFPAKSKLRSRMATGCWTSLVAVSVSVGTFAAVSDHLYARTIRSIPQAFDMSRTDFKKGQGTRPFLWLESPRVLLHHKSTLERLDRDREAYRKEVSDKVLGGIPFEKVPDEAWADSLFRRWIVWPFGIGIETYRYAFMSHKSLRLEAMDPMTNHDNPHNNYLYLLASLGIVGLLAYGWLLLWLLWASFNRFVAPDRSLTDRALAFGVLTSFFSYAVYSIGGFDSIGCSVFLFYLLGCCAVLFEPNAETPRDPLGAALAKALGLGGGDGKAPRSPWWVTAPVVAIVGALAIRTIMMASTVYQADQTFVRPGVATSRSSIARIRARVAQVKEAIKINPSESYYRQSLGNLYSQLSGEYARQASAFRKEGDTERARRFHDAAYKAAGKGAVALTSALHHGWAPENVYISAFQLFYRLGRYEDAKSALRRALEHSPHLGAVRANLARLELETGEVDRAIEDCKWASKADKRSSLAHIVCGRAFMEKGRAKPARAHLKRAKKLSPDDKLVDAYLARLKQVETASKTDS